jgi:putrescine transport system ATP-binding protein
VTPSPALGPRAAAAVRPGAPPEPWRDPKAVPYVRVERVTKRFGPFVAVQDVTLEIYRGELFALLGGSGSGKTTLLRMLAGFETPDEGRIEIDGQDMTGVPPYARPVNMMFQSYALFPHMDVARNVGFGLVQDGVPKREREERVREALELVQLGEFAGRKPHQLSGGQRQRVALARSLVKRPKLLLLDEPLGALDKRLRERTQFELVNIQEKLGITFVMVTHDQEEAMTMSSRLAIMDRGRLAQIGTPAEVYEYPNNRFCAQFIGDVNLFEAQVTGTAADRTRLVSDEAGCELEVAQGSPAPVGAWCWVAIRPEKMTISKEPPPDGAPDVNRAAGVVREIAYTGDLSIYQIDLDSGTRVKITAPNLTRLTELPFTWEERVWVSWRPGSGTVLVQ